MVTTMTQRDVAGTLDWYAKHQTTAQIGFNPNGMCLKVCRTARNIGAMYPSAIAAQVATPSAHRITDVSKIKQGHIMYFDDPKDDNPFGHIVTVQGRVKDADPHKLADLLLWTNSVVSGRLVLVRGNYFTKHWGDHFQFGADWLNGVRLDMPKKPKPERLGKGKIERLENTIGELRIIRADMRANGKDRIADALTRDIKELKETLKKWSA